MLAIRFNRTGKRNQAHFRIVLQEHTKAPGKRHIEILGSYDPHKKTTILKKDRILYWMGQGAQISPVVSNLLVREGVIDVKKIAKTMPRPVVKEEVKAEAVVAEAEAEAKVEESAPVQAEAVVAEAVAESVAEEAKKEEIAPVVEVPKEAVPEAVAEAKEEVAVVAETSPVVESVESETKA